MANLKGCFSHKTDDWATPKNFYDYLIGDGYIDPCPLHSEEDNINKVYPYGSKLFINPPYSKINDWVKFIENNRQSLRVLLIPARTDTKYFHQLLKYNPLIYFLKGRLKFGDSKDSAPFPSLLMVFMDFPPNIFPIYVGTTLENIIEKRLLPCGESI